MVISWYQSCFNLENILMWVHWILMDRMFAGPHILFIQNKNLIRIRTALLEYSMHVNTLITLPKVGTGG